MQLYYYMQKLQTAGMGNPKERKECPICGKTLYDRSTWNRHMRIHTGNKLILIRMDHLLDLDPYFEFETLAESRFYKLSHSFKTLTVPDPKLFGNAGSVYTVMNTDPQL
jgi:hypothetical protein